MRFFKTLALSLISLSAMSSTFAATSETPAATNSVYKEEISPYQWWSPSRITMGAYGGYGVVDGAYENDGAVTFGRLTLGLRAYDDRWGSVGAELGVQSGNTMRLKANDTVIDTLGGLQPQATLKPFVDFLMTVKGQLVNTIPLFGILKGGIAYRQLQLIDSNSSGDTVRKVNGELQLGLGYNLTEHAMLTAFYQGIYAGNRAGVRTDASGYNTYISRIPTEQAGFLGIDYSF